MRIVSNASPLINLARIGKLDLLRELYGEILLPEAVWHEVVVDGAGQPGANEVEAAAWIGRRSAKNKQLVQALPQELDAGEAGLPDSRPPQHFFAFLPTPLVEIISEEKEKFL